MFEKYNINDLYIASVDVLYGDVNICSDGVTDDCVADDLLFFGTCGYGYITVLYKNKDKYIDLSNTKIIFPCDSKKNNTVYRASYVEPLSKYYNQDGSKKNSLGKRKSLKIAERYFDRFHENHLNNIK